MIDRIGRRPHEAGGRHHEQKHRESGHEKRRDRAHEPARRAISTEQSRVDAPPDARRRHDRLNVVGQGDESLLPVAHQNPERRLTIEALLERCRVLHGHQPEHVFTG